MKKVIETIFAIFASIILISLLTFAAGFYYFETYIKEDNSSDTKDTIAPTLTKSADSSNSESKQTTTPIPSKQETANNFQITSGYKFEKFFVIDNLSRKYLEGITEPNAKIILRIDNYENRSNANDQGIFSIELPEIKEQFAPMQIIAETTTGDIIAKNLFTIVLRYFEGRVYFLYSKEKDVFSLKPAFIYKSPRNTFPLTIESDKCVFKQRPTSDVLLATSQNNIISFPSTLISTNFQENKFAIFEVTTTDTTHSVSECIDTFTPAGHTIIWHSNELKTKQSKLPKYEENNTFFVF